MIKTLGPLVIGVAICTIAYVAPIAMKGIIRRERESRYDRFRREYKTWTNAHLKDWKDGLEADIDFNVGDPGLNVTMLILVEEELKNRGE